MITRSPNYGDVAMKVLTTVTIYVITHMKLL